MGFSHLSKKNKNTKLRRQNFRLYTFVSQLPLLRICTIEFVTSCHCLAFHWRQKSIRHETKVLQKPEWGAGRERCCFVGLWDLSLAWPADQNSRHTLTTTHFERVVTASLPGRHQLARPGLERMLWRSACLKKESLECPGWPPSGQVLQLLVSQVSVANLWYQMIINACHVQCCITWSIT